MSKYKSIQLFKPQSQRRRVLEADDNPITVVQIGCILFYLKMNGTVYEPMNFCGAFGSAAKKYEQQIWLTCPMVLLLVTLKTK